MEPQSRTPNLRDQISLAVASLPPQHLSEPVDDEEVDSPEAGYVRIQDWAFTQGFAVVKESRKPIRQVLHCVHHKDDTRNTRKTDETERKRTATKIQATGCKFSIYISFRNKQEKWAIGSTHKEHNHPMNPDPFTYQAHRNKKTRQGCRRRHRAAHARGDFLPNS